MSWSKYKRSFQKLFRRLRCGWQGGHRILVLADSHAAVFEYVFDHDLLAPHLINCEIVGGATAYGLNNDHSITAAFRKFQSSLCRFPDYDVVLIMLGEVDCSFALWNRAAQRGESVVEQIPRAIQGVERILEWGKGQGLRRHYVLAGAILPTIKDHQVDEQYFELRRRVRATQRERTDLVLRFNEALRDLASRRGISYIDITEETIDPVTRVVRDEFLVEGGIDHHQLPSKTAGLWVHKLRQVLGAL